ncbi:MAG: hypothetical protein EZS28_046552, partial [Streblomastix strix]
SKSEDDALLLLKADKTQLIDAYNKTETDQKLALKLNITDQIDAYTKGEDDALLLMKADKTQLIDAYTKGEANNLLNNKADSGVSYTKGEDDALLLLKADKTQLIDSYTKGEADNLLNKKTNSGVSYTKGEDDALLLLKADKTTTYIKTETDYLISQINVGDVDLSGYMTLGTSWTISANKTFNNACRFISSIDGMATITGASFVKSGADDSVVLLGAGGTKPISEFSNSVDDSSYVKKDGDVQDIQGILRKTTLDQPYPEPTDDEYITLGAVKSEFVSSNYSGSINYNLTATSFIKSGKDDTSILLAGGGDMKLSLFDGAADIINNNIISSNFENGNVKVNSTTWSNTQILRIS